MYSQGLVQADIGPIDLRATWCLRNSQNGHKIPHEKQKQKNFFFDFSIKKCHLSKFCMLNINHRRLKCWFDYHWLWCKNLDSIGRNEGISKYFFFCFRRPWDAPLPFIEHCRLLQFQCSRLFLGC